MIKVIHFIINSAIEDAINTAVRAQRLADAEISEEKLIPFLSALSTGMAASNLNTSSPN